jgi:hypothetical protein
LATAAEQIDAMRSGPSWPDLETVAPTLSDDHARIVGDTLSIPTELAGRPKVLAVALIEFLDEDGRRQPPA